SKIMDAYTIGTITEARLEHSVKKILQAKYKGGLNHYNPVGLGNLTSDLNRLEDDILYEELFENAITIVKNKQDILPLGNLEEKTIAYVKMGSDDGSSFLDELKKYAKVHLVEATMLDELMAKLQDYNTVIVGLHN